MDGDRVFGGHAVPLPRTLDALRSDISLADDFALTVAVAPIPLLLDTGRLVRANISIDAGLLEAIDKEARVRGLTRSAFLASAARHKIEARR